MNDAPKSRHVDQPKLCADCMQLLYARIEMNPTASHQVLPCRHAADGVVLAVVAARSRHIVSWTLYGPLDEHEAAALAHTYLRAAAAQGARVHTPALQ